MSWAPCRGHLGGAIPALDHEEEPGKGPAVHLRHIHVFQLQRCLARLHHVLFRQEPATGFAVVNQRQPLFGFPAGQMEACKEIHSGSLAVLS